MPATSIEPTPEQYAIIDTVEVDIETGIMYKKGKPCGTSRPTDGRWILDVWIKGKSKRFMRYNIVWYKAHGEWPKENLDHKDRNCQNDAIHNLVPKSQSANMFNSDSNIIRSNESSMGLPRGVHKYKNGKFRAYINVDAKEKHLGYFFTKEEAINVRKSAELKYYGEYSK